MIQYQVQYITYYVRNVKIVEHVNPPNGMTLNYSTCEEFRDAVEFTVDTCAVGNLSCSAYFMLPIFHVPYNSTKPLPSPYQAHTNERSPFYGHKN